MWSAGVWRRGRCRRFIDLFLICVALGGVVVFGAYAATPETEMEALDFFERAVRPVLAENCFQCHGAERQWAELRVDSKAALLLGGDTGPVIHVGDPENSRLIQALRYDGAVKMPPDGPLDTEIVDAIAHWIRLGAPWPESPDSNQAPLTMEDRIAQARDTHWSFQPVTLPDLPEVTHAEMAQSPVDLFLLEKLEDAGLKFAPRSDARTLLRRIYHDITGLMPDMDAVRNFDDDNTPESYLDVVNDLLDSPHFGERWGRHWLDIARYADTKGYVFQEERRFPFAHTYRDYVIRALNDDRPYDTFIRHQLAADRMDLKEGPGPLAALGFLTLGRRFLNNPHDITDDRIDVVTRGFLGLTVSCARCHDHKYDPIGIDDYYALYGVFRSAEEPSELPLIREPDPDAPEYQAFIAALAEKDREHDALITELHVELARHAREKAVDYMMAVHTLTGVEDAETLRTLARDEGLLWQLVERWQTYLLERSDSNDAVFAPWFAFSSLPEDKFAEQAQELAAQIVSNELPGVSINPRVASVFGDFVPENMADVAVRYEQLLRAVEKEWQDRLSAYSQAKIRQNSFDVVYPESLSDQNAEAIRLVLYGLDSPANIALDAVFDLSDIPTQARIRAVKLAKANIEATHPGRPDRAQALVDSESLFNPHIFRRGNPQLPGDSVPRRNIALLELETQELYTEDSGRLHLADSIASTENPLTARVLVNRVWMHLMGAPLVETPSDFGVRSLPPSHPELLDYLAYRFMEEGWSIKSLIRMIVSSHAYQQDSFDRSYAQAVDPENGLWWRQNRKRMDFEILRDSILAAADNLDMTLYGPSVDITEPPYPNRRTVYSFIERQNLPGLFRTFDFAGPDTHSPMRYTTTVPQQALYMMNNPFVVSQARALASRPELNGADLENGDAVRTLYEVVYQREPNIEELTLAQQFLVKQAAVEPPVLSDWHYGYGRVVLPDLSETTANNDFTDHTVTLDFIPLPHFHDNQWRGGVDMPDAELGWVSLHAGGGHPGQTNAHAVIRRWLAPESGKLNIQGTLRHPDERGDGVIGAIVSSRHGLLWQAHVHQDSVENNLMGIEVASGDTVDFVVLPGPTNSHDSFHWVPELALEVNQAIERWNAAVDFSGPPPPPLTVWEQYAQVLLLSNEFVFVD